jgi:hypothetical protein
MGEPLFPYSVLLWVVRIVLLTCVALHVTAAVQLTRMSWAARPDGYDMKQSIATTYAARTTRWSGVILVAFIVYHLLPQGQPERDERTLNMVAAMGRELFGACSNHGECEVVCPKGIPLEFIARLNRDLIGAALRRRREPLAVIGLPHHPAHEDV